MDEKIVSLETAKLAKLIGFNWLCETCYAESLAHTFEDHHNGNEYTHEYVPPRPRSSRYLFDHDREICKAPTQSQMHMWIRTICNVDMWVERYPDDKKYTLQCPALDNQNPLGEFDTYEEAMEVGIYRILKSLLR
jgi:hypothetical protein